jgi:hypothetical protein
MSDTRQTETPLKNDRAGTPPPASPPPPGPLPASERAGREAAGRDAAGRDAAGRTDVGRDAAGRDGAGRTDVSGDAAGRVGRGEVPVSGDTSAAERAGRAERSGRVEHAGEQAAGRVDHAGRGNGNELDQRMEHAVVGFVDEPRRAVQEAEAVLREALEQAERAVSGARAAVAQGGSDTEALRLALRRYRALTSHLLALPTP